MELLSYIHLPLLECLVLVGIHSYLGIHVIRRKVIFVDLALAQLAALGATVGFLFGIMPDTAAAFVFSLVFAAAGAAVFAFTRMRSERIPHEAVIGLVYAIAAALAVLVIDRAPSGAEHLKKVLVGRIEWVLPHEVLTAAMVYAAIGVIHFVFRDRFFLISEDPEAAFRRGMAVKAWDFLFYLTFGFVISSSVKVAGVLLVFAFLVVPAIAAVMATDSRLYQLLIGWGLGLVVSVVGMVISYEASLPSGPTVVAVYAIVLVFVSFGLQLARSRNRARTVGVSLAALAAAAVFVGFIVVLGNALKDTSLAQHEHHHDTQGAHARHEDALEAAAPPPLSSAALSSTDPELVIDASRERLDGPDRPQALAALSRIVHDDDAGVLYRSAALEVLEAAAGRRFGIAPEADAEANAKGLASLDAWIDSQ
jgi:zinc/manganese transport system permease protein